MKGHLHCRFPEEISLWAITAKGLLVVVSVFLATGLTGQLVTAPQGANTSPPIKEKILLEKVMADLPRYSATPVAAADPKPIVEASAEAVRLVPFVVVGEKGPKLTESELLTKKAYAAEILKQYDYSAFPVFQHRENVRLENMAALQTYADSLVLVGDVEGGRTIKKESSRLFIRPHDPETEYVDTLFNSRLR